jgi:biotin carboxylase
MSLVASAPRVLILALSNWIGAPRLPKAFRRAGFHVTTFAFAGLLMQRSQSVDESVLVSESASADELVSALLEAIERARIDLVVPTDDTTILLLHTAALAAERSGVAGKVLETLAVSLGETKQLATLRSRKLTAAVAERAGVAQPRHANVFNEADALAFAAECGYPLVLKEEESQAGFGVFICNSEAELKLALLRSSQNPAVFSAGLLGQSFVEGRTAMRVVVALRGRVLGGLSAIKLETWPRSTGPSTCVELIEHPEMKASAAAMIEALGYSGFASFDFMLDGQGRAYLIELNPRPTPITHLGERFGSCLCRHLYGALTGSATSLGEPQGLPSKVVLFPQEWVRDQRSPHLVPDVFHDVPWDEPDLVEAYVSFGRAQMRYAQYRLADARNDALRSKLVELETSKI